MRQAQGELHRLVVDGEVRLAQLHGKLRQDRPQDVLAGDPAGLGSGQHRLQALQDVPGLPLVLLPDLIGGLDLGDQLPGLDDLGPQALLGGREISGERFLHLPEMLRQEFLRSDRLMDKLRD